METALLIVGGNWNNESNAGVRTVNANNSAGNANNNIGLRAANCVVPRRFCCYGADPMDIHTTSESCAQLLLRQTSNLLATVSSFYRNPKPALLKLCANA